jgi:adenosylcobinamide kinase/adenosylcobinamide-phosphate guanylyltransferase
MDPRVILIGGGSRSGKSDFALSLARRLGRSRLFLASARAGDDEMRQRIDRHRQTRGPDFATIEEPVNVAAVIRQGGGDVLVFDCLTLWLANLLLEGQGSDAILDRVAELVEALASPPLHVLIVTNEVGMGIVPESELGRAFRDLAGLAHQRLAARADEVYFAVLGTMLRLKPQPAFVPLTDASP